jgi:glycine/serine hydroxymethyltransferase
MNSRGLRSAEIQEVGRIVVEALTTEPSEDDMGRLLKHGLTLTAAFPLYPSLEA